MAWFSHLGKHRLTYALTIPQGMAEVEVALGLAESGKGVHSTKAKC